MHAAGKPGFHPRFQHAKARLLQPARLRSRKRRGVHIGECWPAPLIQRLVQPLSRGVGISGRQRGIPSAASCSNRKASTSPAATRRR